jgi:hypothetical protein
LDRDRCRRTIYQAVSIFDESGIPRHSDRSAVAGFRENLGKAAWALGMPLKRPEGDLPVVIKTTAPTHEILDVFDVKLPH